MYSNMDEAEFFHVAELCLEKIVEQLEDNDFDDIEFEEGVVSFSIGDDKYVINRHVPSKQIWLATPNFTDHFSYDEESERWLNEEGDSLFELLARELDIDLRD